MTRYQNREADKSSTADGANTVRRDRQKATSPEFESQSTRGTESGDHPILSLQKQLGNKVVQRLVKRGTQLKHRTGNPGDQYEREADRVAESVVRTADLDARTSIREGTNTPRKVDSERASGTNETMTSLDTRGGQRLPAFVRDSLEAKLGGDLSEVRLHTDRASAEAARTLNAEAFTSGRNIYFGHGQYRPTTRGGLRLVAHEVTHTLQQRMGKAAGVPPVQCQLLDPPAPFPLPWPMSGFSGGVTEEGIEPVEVQFDSDRPWLFTVEGDPTEAAIAAEVYGAELSMFLEKEEGGPENQYVAVPELLRSPYGARFHELMRENLEEDVRRVEDILFELRINADEERQLLNYVRWWANRKDLRTEAGRSYFDAFIARLKEDQWYRDYGLWEGERSSYLDLLYTEVEEREGQLNTLIAQNSVEFGGYRPTWVTLEPTGEPKTVDVSAGANPEIVGRTVSLILGRLEGITSEDDSTVIADTITGLSARDQAAVLREMMRRYDERDWTGLFGRYGEAWEGGMLYFLFEDLEEEDRTRVAAALRESGTLTPETIDALVAGRGWGGKYLPYTTRKAQEAAQFWADVAVESEGATSAGAGVMGGFASLWLPETAGHTVLTLTGARVLPALGEIHPAVGGTLAVGGTGFAAFTTTLAVQELITGENAWTGDPLNQEDKIARVLVAGSGILLLGATALAVTTAVPGRGAPPTTRIEGTRVMTPEEVALMKSTHVRVQIEGMPPQQELWVPRGSAAARTAYEAGLVEEAALVPTTETTALVPTTGASVTGGAMSAPSSAAPVGTWIPLRPVPGLALRSGPEVPASAGQPAALLPPAEPLALPPGGTFGSYLSNESLNVIESLYGVAVRNSTAAARTYGELRAIADGLGNYRTQYLGTVGELLSADAAGYGGAFTVRPHGRSTEPGPDVPTVTSRGVPEIVMREAKLGSGPRPYRIGESGFPKLYRNPVGLYEYIWGIIRNPNIPVVVRARFKLALDEGNIRWQLDAHGNVRVKIRGTDRFPGELEVATPVTIPIQ